MSFKKWKRGWNRFLAMFLCLIMVVGMLPMDVLAIDWDDYEEVQQYLEERHQCVHCGKWVWEGDGSECEYSEDVGEYHCALGWGCAADTHCVGCGWCGYGIALCPSCMYCIGCIEDGTCPYPHCEYCMQEVGDDYCQACSDYFCDGCFVVCNSCIDMFDTTHCYDCYICFTENPDLKCEFNPNYCIECCNHCEECGRHIFATCFVNDDAPHCCICAEDLGAYQRCRVCGQYHCDLCGDGVTFDRDDEICEECIDGYELWCDICQTAEEDREYDQDGPGQHCIDCCELCPQCGECVIGKEKEVCDICNLCVQCCKELSEEYGCTSGEVCIQDSDWDAHICNGCGICACEADMCEYCGLCEECCAQKTMCSSGMCVEDPEYEEHFCEECGECFCDVTACDTCANARLCEGCCADRSDGEGCPHGICMDSYEWDEHRCIHDNCYEDCVDCLEAENEAPQQHVHVWNADNICTICYARNDGRPVIVEQPRDVKASLRATYQGLAIMPKVHFTARAYGKDAQYEWHIVGKGKIMEGEYGITGTSTSTITVEIPDDGCNGFYTFQCRIYNDKGEVWSDEASLVQDHLYTGLWKEDNTDSTMHYRICVGDGCQNTVKEKHVYNGWNVLKEATQNEDGKAVRTCISCGHEEVLVLPSFSRHVHDWKAEAMPNNRNKHRVACSLCLHVKELAAHDYGDWVVTVKPTEDTKGKQQRTCNSCGYVQTGETPLLEHEHFAKHYYHPADGSLCISHDGCIEYTCLNDDGTENPLFHYQICTATIGGKECGFKSKEYMSKHHWNGNTSGQNGFYRDPETDEVYRECIYCGYREYSDMPGYYCYMLHGNAEYYNEKGERIYWAKVGDKVTACPATKVDDVYFKEWESRGGQCFVLRDKFKKMELDETQKKTKYLTFTMPDQPVMLFCQTQTPSKDVCTHEYTNPKNGKTTSFIEETWAAKEATCTSVGQTRGTQCMACYKEIEKHKTIPATGHDFQLIESTVITPTCTATGYTGDSRCTKCGQILLGDPLPRLGHEYSTELEIIKYPDCIHKGYYGYRCTHEGCQHYMKEVEIPATGHVNTVSEGDKNYHWARCIECDVIVVGTREKHNYDRHIICGGVDYLVCSVCGASKLAENATNQGENKLATISYHAAASGERYCEVERVYQVIGETITLMDPDELGFLPPENMEFRYWSIGSHKYQPGDTYKIVDSEEEICAYWTTPQETVDAVISAQASFPAPGVRVSDMSFYATYSSNYTYYAYGGAEEWYNAETGKKLEKNDRFEFGKAYYLKVRFSQKDASKFLIPTLESVKNMRIVLDTTYYSAASSPKDGFMNGQAFTVEQDGSISVYFGLSKNSNEVYTYDYTSLGITSKVTAQVPEGEVATYRLQNFCVVSDEYEEYNPNIDGEEVREVATILSVSAQNSIMRDEHVEASIDGTTWYKMSELLNTGFGGLYPNTTYKVQLRRTDLGNRLNPFAGQPVVFYETTVKTPSIPEAYLYQEAWPISELAFEQGAYENIFQLEDAVITAEVQGVYYPTIRYKVTSDKLEDFCDKKMYVTLTKRSAGHPETVVGGGVAKLQADGTFLYKIPEGLSCNTAYAFFMGFESNGTGKVDDVWYSTIKWTDFDFTEMKIVGIQNTKEWVTADTAWVTTQDYAKLMGEPIPEGKRLRGWYSVTDGKEYVIGTDRWIDIYLKGAVTLYPVWDTQYYYGDRVMLFDVEPVKGEQAILDKVKFSGKIGELTHSSARLTTVQELKAAMIAASNYSLSDEKWAALDNECANMIATNGWYYKGQKFTGTFVKGEEYTLKLYVSSDCGSDFSTSDRNLLWIDAKGQEQYTHCELVPGSNNQIARVELTFTAKTPATEVQTITSASVTLDKMPEIGEEIFVPTLTTDGNSKFETTVYDDGLLPGWFEDDPTNDYLWYPGASGWTYGGRETFEEGRNYYVCLKLAANDGYKFPEISSNDELAAFLSLSMGGKSVAVKTANGNENPNFELHQYKTPTENEIVVVVNWKAEGLDASSPVLLGAEAKADGISFTWKANAGVFTYAIFRKEEGGKWIKIATTTGTGDDGVMAEAGSTCSYVDGNVEVGKTYIYTARGINANGKYITNYDMNGVTVTMAEVLDASSPVLGGATVGAGGITVTWTANSGVPKYAVFRKVSGGKWTRIAETTGSGNESVKADAGTTCSYADGTAAVGTTYTYTVRGLDESGKYVTNFNAKGVTATMTSVEVLDASSPVLGGATAGANGITVTWTANSGVPKYAVFRKVTGGKWTRIAETTGSGKESVKAEAGSTCSYADGTAAVGTTYTYTVRGLDEDGKYVTNFNANGVSATMTSAEVLDASSPVLGNATAGANGITVTWTANSGVPKYAVFRKVTGGKWKKIAETTGSGNEGVKANAGSTCSYVDGSAVTGTTYIYTVRGLDEDGKYVTNFDANGVTATMTIPEVLDASSPVLGNAVAGADGITVTWTANSGVPKYAVFRKVAGGKWAKVGETTGSGTEGMKADAGSTCSYLDGTAEVGTTYTYTVRGLDESGKFVTSYDAKGICCTK